MIIKNVKVYTESMEFVSKEIAIRDGRFAEVKDADPTEEVLDGEGCYAIPGLIDLHFHGCKGYDFCDGTKEAIARIAEYEASVGVTAIAPATMTLPVNELEEILAVAAAYKEEAKDSAGADLIGVNMEGPFISEEKKGAQDARNIISCNEDICRRFLQASGGLVKFVGIAPERSENTKDFILKMKDQVHISLAHTNADYDTAMEAFKAGADHAVHLYNAMPAFTHRNPGVVGAVSDSAHVNAEMICDGVHIHPSVVRATFKMLGADRIILISDSMRATGMPDGRYTLGGLEVDVTGNRATLASNGALAGSATNLMDCMRTAVLKMGIPLETAVACATRNPARCLGVYGEYGSITPGKRGNAVLLDRELKVKAVIKDGVLVA
ncbi:MAG: N-acetylglucosamine-6-phosphate deacetylase [Dorea sp.]|jgi:N-acetylglucosamine-6-phosphate deacetylase|nr:N-acetylglucosamine-6-phosphate deacetylase [Dorea sp.]MCI9226638.1 N-acetylglucosamine-6-phosphate deacetylase [Dorea sp.]